MATEYRTIDRHGKGTLDLEFSTHAEGSDWRGWKLVGGALPAEIAKIRCDCGNGLISKDEMVARTHTWCKAQIKKRNRKAA
jgi:hypothetical protein